MFKFIFACSFLYFVHFFFPEDGSLHSVHYALKVMKKRMHKIFAVNGILVSTSRKTLITKGTEMNIPPLLCEGHNLDSITEELVTFFLKPVSDLNFVQFNY